MRKILSFFTLSVFLIIIFSRNLVMAFDYDGNMNHQMVKVDHCMEDGDSEKCIFKCLEKIDIEKNASIKLSEIKLKNYTYKFSKDFKNLSLFFIQIKDKSFFKINSPPPDLNKKNGNYAYHNLIKIIKSNT